MISIMDPLTPEQTMLNIDPKYLSSIFDNYKNVSQGLLFDSNRGIYLSGTNSEYWWTLRNAAKQGLIGHYWFLQNTKQRAFKDNPHDLNPSNYVSDSFFFEKNNPAYFPVPFIASLNIKEMNLEFGKIINPYDAIDLEKSGIKTRTNKGLMALNDTINFITCWVAKTTKKEALKRTFATMCKSGIIFSMPRILAEQWHFLSKDTFSVRQYKIHDLSIQFKNFICPRCESHFKIINSDSIIGNCPSCNARFSRQNGEVSARNLENPF